MEKVLLYEKLLYRENTDDTEETRRLSDDETRKLLQEAIVAHNGYRKEGLQARCEPVAHHQAEGFAVRNYKFVYKQARWELVTHQRAEWCAVRNHNVIYDNGRVDKTSEITDEAASKAAGREYDRY